MTGRTLRRNVLVCLAGTIAAAALAAGFARGEETPRQVQVVAHRAGAAAAPENTLAALERAMASGADMAEIDVQMTRDGVLVALHDDNLLRTTGWDGWIGATDSKTVRELDAGAWFSEEFAGEPVPTLEELLEASRGRISLMLEVKGDGRTRAIVEQTVKQLREKGLTAQCILASTRLEDLRRGKQLAPELETVVILEQTYPELWGKNYVNGYSVSLEQITLDDVERAHRENRAIYTWTANGELELIRAFWLGVDGVVTDDPALAAELQGKGRYETLGGG